MRHSYNMKNQFRHYKVVRQTLKSTECFIHIDFAEQWSTKQTLWGFEVADNTPNWILCNRLHGNNTFVLWHIRHSAAWPNHSMGIPSSNITEHQGAFLWGRHPAFLQRAAGHGKGISDGIGAVMTRYADMRVRHGHDVTNASSWIEQVTKSSEKVQLYKIDEHMVRRIEEKIKDKTVKTIPGTIKMHQLIIENPGVVKHSETSCLCEKKTVTLVINWPSSSVLLTR